MFMLEGFITLRESYIFYFSSLLIISISVIIAIGQCYQAFYKETVNKVGYYLIEACAQITRIIQYIFIVSLATNTPTSAFNSNELWDKIFLSLYKMTFPEIIWDFVGYVVVFGTYHYLLYKFFTKTSIADFMKKRQITKFSVESAQYAVILCYKNLFIIPVSFIYILIVLKII